MLAHFSTDINASSRGSTLPKDCTPPKVMIQQSAYKNAIDSSVDNLDSSTNNLKILLFKAFEDLYKTTDHFDHTLRAELIRERFRLRVKVFNQLWLCWLEKRLITQRHLDRLPAGSTAILLDTEYTFTVSKRVKDAGQIWICGGDQPYMLEQVDRVTVGGASHV
jgi:hypothetical protein